MRSVERRVEGEAKTNTVLGTSLVWVHPLCIYCIKHLGVDPGCFVGTTPPLGGHSGLSGLTNIPGSPGRTGGLPHQSHIPPAPNSPDSPGRTGGSLTNEIYPPLLTALTALAALGGVVAPSPMKYAPRS